MAEKPGDTPIIGGGDPNFGRLPFDRVVDGNVERGHILIDKSKPQAPPPTTDYHPTLVYVACSQCRTVGDIAFPNGFDYKIGDKIMDRRVFKAFCLNCKKMADMVPLDVKMAMENLAAILRRHYVNVRQMKQEGVVGVEDEEFVRVYEKLYGEYGYPPGYDVPVEGQEIPDELKHLLIRKDPNRG
jgi:hypothetical protein